MSSPGDAPPDGLITVDEAGVIVELNQSAEEIFGITRASALGESMRMIIPPEMREESFAGLHRVVAGGKPRFDERRQVEGLHADGSRLPIDLLITRTSLDPQRYTARIRDRSPSAPAGGANRRSERLRKEDLAARAEEAAGLGSLELGVMSGEQYWSDNLYRLMGVEVGEIEPSFEYMLEQVHPDDTERVESLLEGLHREAELEPIEYRIVWPTGEVRHLRATLSISERVGDQPDRAIGSVQDVTEQRRSEREVAAHLAVIKNLREWTSLKERGPAMLGDLARVFDAAVGVIWIPRGDVLENHAVWPSRLRGEEFLAATHGVRLPRGAGLPGRAWERREPVSLADFDELDGNRARAAREADLEGGFAFPALYQEEVLMVVELLADEQIELTEGLSLSLIALGQQLGQFLTRHRGELIPHLLTARELELLQLASEGLSGPGIAERLVISPATVKSHFENIYGKLHVPDRASAVAEVLRLGLIE